MSYAETVTEHLRGVILLALAASPAATSNALLLQKTAETLGVGLPMDEVYRELGWLAGGGLISCGNLGSVVTATLTLAGLDVAERRVEAPGVTITPRFPQ